MGIGMVEIKEKIIKFVKQRYNAAPEYLWRRYPTYCIFRRADNKKWFALIGSVPRKTFGLAGDGDVDIINLKTDNADFLCGVRGIFPAYHMNKVKWVSVLLDGTVTAQNVQKLIEMSYELTK